MVIIQNLPKEIQDKITLFTIEPSRTAKIFKTNVIIRNVIEDNRKYKMLSLRTKNNEIIEYTTTDEYYDEEDSDRLLYIEKYILFHKVMTAYENYKNDYKNNATHQWITFETLFKYYKRKFKIDITNDELTMLFYIHI